VQLEAIMSETAAGKPPTKGEAALPALTALDRTKWAEIREDQFSAGVNKLSLEEIESAMMVPRHPYRLSPQPSSSSLLFSSLELSDTQVYEP